MVVFLIVMGVILGAAAVNGTIPELGKQMNKDLFSKGTQAGFLKWVLAVLVISSITKAINLPDAGKVLLVLIFLAFILSSKNGDLLTSIVNQISSLQGPGGAATPGSGSGGSATPAK